MADYHKAGLLAVRRGRILLCRKRTGTQLLILPGGRFEGGESALECLARELREELGDVEAMRLERLGCYTDRAAGEPSKTVQIELFRGELAGDPEPRSEIEELVWFGEDDDRALLAPSLANQILPDLLARGILRWGGVELLAPARDLECGLAAIDCGADAVYIGAPRFGAREAAGASLESIARLAEYAHRYWARVYVALNTLLFDHEIPDAVRLAWELHDIQVDGLIIQDVGLLECELPPLPLIASTQMHNHTPARVAFLERVGFRRAILARELTLDQIREIRRAAPHIELECFIHGALCVCYSGQCYLSYALGGRSGNRGECAQPCRKPYTLVDATGRTLAANIHPLSLRDLNLSGRLPDLLQAGVRSFKVEGRLKDQNYVANVVAHYRSRLDEAIRAAGLRKVASGASSPSFTPDIAKTFNRGYTAYFLDGRGEPVGSLDTPKMMGEPVGVVAAVGPRDFTSERTTPLHPGDGICFFDRAGALQGTTINGVQGRTITPDRMEGIEPGVQLYRNHDHEFLTRVSRSRPERLVAVSLAFRRCAGGFEVEAVDEDGNRARAELRREAPPADKPERALQTIQRQLKKTGGTEFHCIGATVEADPAPFLSPAALNELRRQALTSLAGARARNRPRLERGVASGDARFPDTALSYLGNVLNRHAEAFYRRCGVLQIEPGAESGIDLRGRTVMTTRYCLKDQLGACPRTGAPEQWVEPLTLIDADGRRLELCFDCEQCQMEVILAP